MKRSEVAAVAKDVDEYYHACARDGWKLPTRKSPIITKDYLNGVSRSAPQSFSRDA
jgi:hypothetical protein